MRFSLLVFIATAMTVLASCVPKAAEPIRGQNSAAADYCTQNGGTVETRYPF